MFNKAVITAKGLALNAKIVAGQTNAVFTAIRLGNGVYDGTENLNVVTTLKSIKQTFGISSIMRTESNAVRLRSVIDNLGIEEGYYISEVGIYAQDPDNGEILYSIALGVKNKMDYQPSESELEGATSTFDTYTVISNAESATITMGTGAMASAEDVEELRNEKLNSSDAITNDEIDDLDELVYIPKFKNSDVIAGGSNNTHPAFIVNGVEIPGFYYSKYQNIVKTVDGVNMAYSLYGKDPAVNINFDNARARCEAKGKGYHLSTMAEWAAIALWCKKNGTMPYGNNNYGKDINETDYVAIPTSQDTNDTSKTGRVATGTGPITWSHDETQSGIWDINGNVWEWQGGYRIAYGEVQIIANNDASDPNNPQNPTSQLWKAISAATGALVAPGTAGTVKLDYVSGKWTYNTSIIDTKDESRSCAFSSVTFAADIKQPAQDVLRALAMLPVAGDTSYGDDYFWANNGASERLAYRGGRWSSGTNAGVFGVSGSDPRSGVGTNTGFRSAYIPELES